MVKEEAEAIVKGQGVTQAPSRSETKAWGHCPLAGV